jgi:predicted  nucleic acid-binding Zn-ribbon protein
MNFILFSCPASKIQFETTYKTSEVSSKSLRKLWREVTEYIKVYREGDYNLNFLADIPTIQECGKL